MSLFRNWDIPIPRWLAPVCYRAQWRAHSAIYTWLVGYLRLKAPPPQENTSGWRPRHLGHPQGRKSADNMHSITSEFVFNVLNNERRRLIIQVEWVRDGCGEERKAREGSVLSLCASFHFRRRRFRFRMSDPCLAYDACDRNENKSKNKEKEETERRERNVINNVMKFLRRVETRRRHLRRDFMKSLNSPARKDIIKFPTVKFAFPSQLLPRTCLSRVLPVPLISPRCILFPPHSPTIRATGL